MKKIRTVDALITIDHRQVLLIRRAKPPFMEKLALPGGHVEKTDVSLRKACAREVHEEIGVVVSPYYLLDLVILNTPGRDPRYPQSTSAVFTFNFSWLEPAPSYQAGSDAREVVVRDLFSLRPEEFGFDHFLAIEAFMWIHHRHKWIDGAWYQSLDQWGVPKSLAHLQEFRWYREG